MLAPKMSKSTLKALHDAGFALHWLKPKSKAPVNSGWTKGPRLSWPDFSRGYRLGANLGVRTGEPSVLSDGSFLAVIDVDIKGTEPRFRAEAADALRRAFPKTEWAKTPRVISGRGGGSCHFYVRTQTGVSGEIEKSTEAVPVLIPNAGKPTARDITALTPEELAKGFRIRNAWEISFLATGRQVVLPPSIHPDTGAAYRWATPFPIEGVDALPILEYRTDEEKQDEAETDQAMVDTVAGLPSVDLSTLNLRPEMIAGIRDGAGVLDRSAFAFSVSLALFRRETPVDVVLSVLTDRRFFIGQVGFDHAKTESRTRAALWVRKYCIEKALRQIQVQNAIQPLDETKFTPGAWVKELDVHSGGKGLPAVLRSTYKNLRLILKHEAGENLLKRNLFACEDEWCSETPWGYAPGRKRSGNMDDALKIKLWLIERFSLEAPTQLIDEVLNGLANEHAFHPVKDFLESLTWDGTPRVTKAFETYLGGTMPETYQDAVCRKFFTALIARIYEPGVKFDHVVIFEGAQGVGKSSFGRILVGDRWFMDALPDLADKDAALYLQGIWLIEMAELSALRRSEIETAKAFITRQFDKIRPPYGSRRVEFPRQCVFFGSTNAKTYLADSTGNRRFWPVKMTGLDFEALERDREQLLAEALVIYRSGTEKLYLESTARRTAEGIQESRRVETESDSVQAAIAKWAANPVDSWVDVFDFTVDDLFAGPLSNCVRSHAARVAAGECLAELGFEKRKNHGRRFWSKPKS